MKIIKGSFFTLIILSITFFAESIEDIALIANLCRFDVSF